MAHGDGGGVGNERGSVHRRGVAVLLAAYGLAGRPLTLHDGTAFLPQRLDFETDQPTDDLTVTTPSGARLFLSAKRTCGNDELNLGATVAQWVRQAPTLRPGDVLGLATARLKGDLEQLRTALHRHHHQPGTAGPADVQAALTALTQKIRQKTPDPAVQQRVLDAAYVLETTAVAADDEGFQLAAALLAGSVVAAPDGPAAARALAQAFHTQASTASGSELADWMHILRDAGLTVFADGTGPAGAAEHTRQLALHGYRTRLGDQLDRVELALLSEHHEPLTVAGLADRLRVVVGHPSRGAQPDPLLAMARRWPRLLLTGLPGMGKSTALRQLAARWATDPAAPTPVLVPLPVVADRCRHPGDVTLSVLCEVAARSAPAGQRAVLAEALERTCRTGPAVLLLDAFDECGPRRPILADGLQTVLAALPPQAGIVLATRDIGLPAAQRLGLPTAELATPDNLEQVLDRLLHAVAERTVEPPQRENWTAARRRWIRAARRDHPDIGQVPLLATLMTLVVADSTEPPTAQGQAHLLQTAVERSVRGWEQRRPDAVGSRPGEPTPEQLIHGFAALGTLLTTAGSAIRVQAEDAVTTMLAEQWHVRAPGPARALTEHILTFWDQHVGVFVMSVDDRTIKPRSRVFAEIGAAMAAHWLTDDELAAWVDTAVTDIDRRTALLLAGELDQRVLSRLLTEGAGDPAALALTATTIIDRGTPVTDARYAALLPLLAQAARQVRAGGDGSPWTYVVALAALRLPEGLRLQRSEALARLCADEEQRILAAALVALADAAADDRPLTAGQAAAVRAALIFPLPANPVRFGRRRRRRPLPGHGRIVAASIAHLPVLGEDMVRPICTLSDALTWRDFTDVTHGASSRADIADALRAAGYEPEPAQRIPLPDSVVRIFDDLGVQHDDHVLPILQAVVVVGAAIGEIPAHERWRLPDLCALCAVIDVREATFQGYLAARTEPEVLPGWLKAAATAAGLDLAAVTAQAQAAITEHARQGQPTVWAVLSAPAPTGPPAVDPHRLTDSDLDALLAAAAAESEWIAQSACHLLRERADAQLDERLAGLLERLPTDRRERAAEFLGLREPGDDNAGLQPWPLRTVLERVRQSARHAEPEDVDDQQ